jgi:outer membrane protein OmpA-like peptidoglycan-associated protein
VKGGFDVQGLALPRLAIGAGAGYRWEETGDVILSDPFAQVSAGWRIHAAGPLSVTPLADFAVSFPGGNSVSGSLGAALRLAVRLSGRDYLTLTPAVSVPLFFDGAADRNPHLSVALGTRREQAWMVRLPEVVPSLLARPALFSPDGDGEDDTVVLSLKCRNPGALARWKLEILASGGNIVREWAGQGSLPDTLVWDGIPASGGEPSPATDYRAVLETIDVWGRSTRAETGLTIDILVIKDDDRYKIRVPDIRFPAYSYELSESESSLLLQENQAVLLRIASLFTRFPEYRLIVEGYAHAVYGSDPAKFAIEQQQELLPLSLKRAETVKMALVMLGVDPGRITTNGLGGLRSRGTGSDPGVSGKNRRVEFILAR